MSFDYSTLKQITSSAIVANTIINADFASGAVTNSTLAGSTVGSSNMAGSSVSLSSGTVSGTLGYNQGGTGLTSYPNDQNTILRTNSSANGMEYGYHGLTSMSVFTSSGTWNRPSNVRYIKIQVQAGGGGGGGHGESGGAGGYAERILEVAQNGISSVSVTCGGDASGTYYANGGNNGSGSSFGPYVSAGAGYGCNAQNQHSGGVSGTGSGGDLNIYTGGGGCHHHSFGPGGRCFFGGSVAGGHPNGGNFAHNHQSHSTPGSGGRGAYFHGHRGSDGKGGCVIVTEYR